MILTKSQIDNITRNIIVDYIKSKKIVNTSYEDIVKRIPSEYLDDPMIREELNTYPYNDNGLVDIVMVKVCRQFIKDVEGTHGRPYIKKDPVIDFRKKVEACIKEAGNVILYKDIDNEDSKEINW